MTTESGSKSQVIPAPSWEPFKYKTASIFLAGTTSRTDDGDWRIMLAESLSEQPVTLLNPNRADWDSTWREDIEFAPYREQVEWELDMQEKATMVVVYFHPQTQAPISLLELGLCARADKALVVCPKGYWKRGNVEIVCKRFGIEMLESIGELKDAILRKTGLS